MWSSSPRRRAAVASKLLGMVLGMVLGLSSIAAGARLGLTSLAVAREDQVHNKDEPERPPLRRLLTEPQNDGGDDERADAVELAAVASHRIGLCTATSQWIAFLQRDGETAYRVCEGQGARPPPSA